MNVANNKEKNSIFVNADSQEKPLYNIHNEMTNDCQICINLDKLILSVFMNMASLFIIQNKDDEIIEINDYLKLKKIYEPKFGYKKTYKVILEDEVFAYLRIEPKVKYKNVPVSILDIENSQLYTDAWFYNLEYILESLCLSVNYIKQIDICIDGTGFLSIGEKLLDKDILKIGSAKFSPVIKGNNDLQSYIVGLRQSGKIISCYKKLQEIIKKQKQYIKEFWKSNGIKDFENMERLELRMFGSKIQKWKGVKDEFGNEILTLENLQDTKTLITIFKNECSKFFEFVENDKTQTRKDRMKPYPFLDWEKLGCKKIVKPKKN